MSHLRRCIGLIRGFWRIWIPLVLLSALLPPLAVIMPLVEKQLIDGVILPKRLSLLPGTILLFASIWTLSTAGLVVANAVRAYADQKMSLRLRHTLFAHYQRLALSFSGREHTGRAIALFSNDVPIVSNLFSSTIIGLVGSSVAIIAAAVAMWSLNWQLALAAGIVPPVIAAFAWLITRPLRPASRRAQDKAAELTEHFQENLAGLREIVAFGREQVQELRFTATLNELLRLRMRVTLVETAVSTGQLLLSLTVTLVILGYGGYLVITGRTTLGTLVAMRSLFGLVFTPAGQIAGLISNAQKAMASADRVLDCLDQQPPIADRPGARRLVAPEGHVMFDAVTFGYQPERSVLRDISFKARPGEVIALVGPSGAGKSTLASLLARFHDPQAGIVSLDGVDLRDIALSDLRARMAMVFQDTFLFATTIRDNIAFGTDGATEEAIVAAARSANAWEFIEQLPAGLDTHVGERGIRLSEGQKQRIAIARALVRDPRILILDEPTSALDARSERLLQSALDNLMRGRTTFVIAHRLATVRRADRIVVLDRGRIVEQGTHDELLSRNGLYRELYELQFAVGDGDIAASEPVSMGRSVAAMTTVSHTAQQMAVEV